MISTMNLPARVTWRWRISARSGALATSRTMRLSSTRSGIILSIISIFIEPCGLFPASSSSTMWFCYYLFAGLGLAGLVKHLWLDYGQAVAAEVETIAAQSAEGDILRYRFRKNIRSRQAFFRMPLASLSTIAALESIFWPWAAISPSTSCLSWRFPPWTFRRPRQSSRPCEKNMRSVGTSSSSPAWIHRSNEADRAGMPGSGPTKKQDKVPLSNRGEGDDLTAMIEEAA